MCVCVCVCACVCVCVYMYIYIYIYMYILQYYCTTIGQYLLLRTPVCMISADAGLVGSTPY